MRVIDFMIIINISKSIQKHACINLTCEGILLWFKIDYRPFQRLFCPYDIKNTVELNKLKLSY